MPPIHAPPLGHRPNTAPAIDGLGNSPLPQKIALHAKSSVPKRYLKTARVPWQLNELCEKAQAGDFEFVKQNVRPDADVNQKAEGGTCEGLTPLCAAAKGGREDTYEVVKFLLDHRTKIENNKLVFHTDVEMRGKVLPQNIRLPVSVVCALC